MATRWMVLGLMLALAGRTASAADADAAKEGLQKLNEFIGTWNGEGKPEKAKAKPEEFWREKITWGWKFKGDDAWLAFEVKDGKYYKAGTIKFQEGKKPYTLALVPKDGDEVVYEGELKKGRLLWTRTDKATGKTQELTMNVAGDGVFLNYTFAEKRKGSSLATKLYTVSAKKDGETFAGGAKKPECIVTGGLGTIQVGFGGKTYYVCCSGCKEAFDANPAKYVNKK